MTDATTTKLPENADLPQRTPPRFRLRLRNQGLILLFFGVVLVVAYGFFMVAQRGKMVDHFIVVETEEKLKETFVRISSSLFRVDREIHSAIESPDPAPFASAISTHFAKATSDAEPILKSYPLLAAEFQQMKGDIDAFRDGNLRAHVSSLGHKIHHIATELDTLTEDATVRRNKLSSDHLEISVDVARMSIAISVAALVSFGAFVIYFFNRLTSSIETLRARAREVQAGWYSMPLAIDRGDEIGELMEAMNNMAATLRRREKDLAISRQRYFHQEKMTAVKSLASGLAHEIGNPLETISIVAQEIIDAKEEHCVSKGANCNPQLILDQTRRVSRITREISNFTAPSTPDAEQQDLNEIIRGIYNFLRYDPRYRLTDLKLELDPNILPVHLVADQFTQVILNLLINAADACEGIQDRAGRVVVRTQPVDNGVVVRVIDNGHGMNQETLSRAFEPYFTTKPPERGSGLGLVVCKSIVEACGGTMRLISQEQIGTTVEIFFPTE